MATATKTKTTTAKDKVEETTVEQVEENTIATPQTTAKQPKKFAQNELIPCRSVTFGELLCEGPKSHLLYSFANYNDVTEIEFQDLQALRSTRSSYLFRPRFIIENDELVEQWSKDFKDMYDNIVTEDIDEIFSLPLGKFKARIKNAPKGVQQAIKNIAGEKIMNGSLDSIAKIKAIDEILGTDLKIYLD